MKSANFVFTAALLACAAAPAQDPKAPRRGQAATAPAARIQPAQRAAEVSQSELIKRRAKKLAKEVFDQAPWFFDYDEARAAAAAEGKLVLTYFTRSYAP